MTTVLGAGTGRIIENVDAAMQKMGLETEGRKRAAEGA